MGDHARTASPRSARRSGVHPVLDAFQQVEPAQVILIDLLPDSLNSRFVMLLGQDVGDMDRRQRTELRVTGGTGNMV